MIRSIYTKIENVIETKVFKYLFLTLALVYSASFATWVLFDDNYYYYVLYDTPQASPMTILYLVTGKLWINNVCSNILSVNFLGWLLSMASMLLFYIAFVDKNKRLSYLNYLSVGILFMGNWTHSLYNPDSISLLVVTSMLILLIKRFYQRMWELCILAAMTAALIALRFPNILILLVVALFLVIDNQLNHNSIKKTIVYALAYTVSTVLMYVLLMCLLLETWDLAGYLHAYLNREPVQSINTHDPYLMFCWYRDDMMRTIRNLTMIVGSVGCAYMLGFIKSKHAVVKAMTLLFPIYIIFKFRSDILVGGGWNTLFGFSISLLLLHSAYNEGKLSSYARAFLVIALSFIGAAGSDSGLQKCLFLFAVVTPVALIQYKKQVGFTMISKGILIIYLVSALFVFLSVYKSVNLNTYINYPTASVFTNKDSKSQLEQRCEKALKYKVDGHTIMYGRQRYAVEAITGVRGTYSGGFFSNPQDDIETANVSKLFVNDPKSVLIDYSKSQMLKEKMACTKAIMSTDTVVAYIYTHKYIKR